MINLPWISVQEKYKADWPHPFSEIVFQRIFQSDWHRIFFTLQNFKFSNHVLPFLNQYHYSKYDADRPSCSCDMATLWILGSDWAGVFSLVDSRILQSDWPRAYSAMSNLKSPTYLLNFLNLYLHAKNLISS